jgi:lincosamide nucleotidyltransferase A/C/D/E
MTDDNANKSTGNLVTSAKDVVDFYCLMERAEINIWVDGGWGVDALLGKQLRPHKDLDIAVEWKDVPRLREVLATYGYAQVREDSQWNFVLADDGGHEVDVHAFVYDDDGNIVDGVLYPAKSLTGSGTIDGHSVRCISSQYQVEFLAPWIHKWPEKYLEAVSSLCEQFQIRRPEEYTRSRKQD